MAKYYVRQSMDYPDTESSYKLVHSKAAVADELIDFGYLDNPSVFVYIVDNSLPQPWEIFDPYPDWVVSRGPRGGVMWERA